MSGIVAIVFANVIWGFAPALFKYVLNDIPPFTLAFIRFFFAGIIFLPFGLMHVKKLTAAQWGHIVLGALWGISINITFFFLGLPMAPSINVHVINSLGPIALYFLSLVLLHEKAHPQIIKGMLVSCIGVAIILFAPFLFQHGVVKSDGLTYTATQTLIGNMFFIISMVGGVLFAIHNKKISKDVHPYFITCFQFLIGSMTFAPLMYLEFHSGMTIIVDQKSWTGIIYGIFFASALAYFLHNYAITRMNAQEIGVYTYIMPIVGVVVAIPLLGEYPDVYFAIGACCIAIGIWMSERHPHFHSIHKR